MAKDISAVYHYCSVETFFKIITNKEVWLTDVSKSNDSKELKIIISIIENKIKERVKKAQTDNIGSSDFVPMQMLSDVLDEFKKIEQLFHVCCFSSDRDSLSQWSMYADNATGIAIGFDKSKLEIISQIHSDLTFNRVEYSTDTFSSSVDKKLNEVTSLYLDNPDDEKHPWFTLFMRYLIEDISRQTYLYKNASFAQENEYRLVFNSKPLEITDENGKTTGFTQTINKAPVELTSNNTLSALSHYYPKGKIVSYRALQIKNMSSILKEIVIAPKSSVTRHDVEMFLIANGIDLSITNIKVSESTYR